MAPIPAWNAIHVRAHRLFLHSGLRFHVFRSGPNHQWQVWSEQVPVRPVSMSDNLISKACPGLRMLGELARFEQRGVLGSSSRVICVVMLKVQWRPSRWALFTKFNFCLFYTSLPPESSVFGCSLISHPPSPILHKKGRSGCILSLQSNASDLSPLSESELYNLFPSSLFL